MKDIQIFDNILQLYGLKLIKYTSYQTFKIDLQTDMDNLNKNLNMNYFDLVEIEINDNKKKIIELTENYNNITEKLGLLIEKKSVYDKLGDLLFIHKLPNNVNNNNEFINNSDNNYKYNYKIITPQNKFFNSEIDNKNANLLDDNSSSDFQFISGVIKAEDLMKFKRMIFRVSRGRAFLTFFDLTIENKALKIKQEKKIFVSFFHGRNFLFNKIINICDLFGANRFIIPKKEELPKEIFNLQQEIFDKKNLFKNY